MEELARLASENLRWGPEPWYAGSLRAAFAVCHRCDTKMHSDQLISTPAEPTGEISLCAWCARKLVELAR